MVALELHGSKTPGELAFLLEDTTLLTGELIRGHVGGRFPLAGREPEGRGPCARLGP
ncbi:hypothetical protein JKA73_10205 [Myxococcus xanthus]|uniref:hypothetical protein n=1 Tax=Myxococcus xanthus TaxID=34 RepID=UPI00191798DE|nr:hypothetical protein [Myxococcus xanthus]QQR46418.1 hypothetical protein JKA73_10205 [Myxococcus xanthus]